MSVVSAAISPQLNINDSLGCQVLAGQRRGEKGMTLDKTGLKRRSDFFIWHILFCLSQLEYMQVCHQQILLLTRLFYCPVFPFSEEMDLFVFPVLILPPGISRIPSSVCVHKCVYLWSYWFVTPCMFPSYPHMYFLERTSWTLMFAAVMVVMAGHTEESSQRNGGKLKASDSLWVRLPTCEHHPFKVRLQP